MHLVFLNQYYPPDAAPTGVMLADLVEGLLRQGHEVTVLCAAGGYAGVAENPERRTSNIELRTSNERGREPGRGALAASAENPEHRTSNIELPTSNERGGEPGRGALAEDCEHRTSNIELPTSNERAGEPGRGALAALITDNRSLTTLPLPRPRIVRIGATAFGRSAHLGKLIDYATYYAGVAWKLLTLRPAPDRIVALTTPPYLSVLARLVSKFRAADHAHWVMDLYPDVMVAHGMLEERGVFYRILGGVARWGFGGRRCAAVLTLGPDMAERVGRRVVDGPLSVVSDCEREPRRGVQALPTTDHRPPTTVSWVPLWTGEGADGPLGKRSLPAIPPAALALRRQRGWSDEELIVMYSGNMGLGHRMGEILAAARKLTGRPVRFVFFGGGKRRGEVEQFVRGNPDCAVELHDYAPADGLAAHLQSADVHLTSLDVAWTGTMVPSKVQGIFGATRPVIFMGSAQSSIGRWVQESGGGWVVVPGDVAGLLGALEEALDPVERAARGRAAKGFADEHFDKATNVRRVAAVLGRMA